MADWIKSRVVLHEEREVLAIAAELSMDRFAVIGRLLRIWGWFDQHTNNGNAPGATDALLDELVGQKGFSSAMRGARWLFDLDGGGLRIPKWSRHNGTSGKKRANGQKRSQRWRNAHASRTASPEERRGEENTNTPQPPAGRGANGIASRGEQKPRRMTAMERKQDEFKREMAAEAARLEAEGK